MDKVDGALGTMAISCKLVRFEMPNIFVAVFDQKTSKDFCEKESARLQGVLSQSVGEAVKVRMELDAPMTQPMDREQYLSAAENPLVLKIQEAFGVTLHEVRR
jgi:hypothetical protein